MGANQSTSTWTAPRIRLRAIRRRFEAAGFWAAIALPFLYVPLLFSGPSANFEQAALLGLLVLHVVALVIGHSYDGTR